MKTQMTHDEAVEICQTLTPTRGAPPEIGWWMVSYCGNKPKMRWWNGLNWSIYCTQEEAESKVLDFLAPCKSNISASALFYYPRVWEGIFLARKEG